mmetsp:Transcript_4723/g.14415  ORF Transcript_4723/g.14415 Transcript_4723/m.14415 type:complete len:380 (-) Transcript_4723:4518-5657(-)
MPLPPGRHCCLFPHRPPARRRHGAHARGVDDAGHEPQALEIGVGGVQHARETRRGAARELRLGRAGRRVGHGGREAVRDVITVCDLDDYLARAVQLELVCLLHGHLVRVRASRVRAVARTHTRAEDRRPSRRVHLQDLSLRILERRAGAVAVVQLRAGVAVARRSRAGRVAAARGAGAVLPAHVGCAAARHGLDLTIGHAVHIAVLRRRPGCVVDNVAKLAPARAVRGLEHAEVGLANAFSPVRRREGAAAARLARGLPRAVVEVVDRALHTRRVILGAGGRVERPTPARGWLPRASGAVVPRGAHAPTVQDQVARIATRGAILVHRRLSLAEVPCVAHVALATEDVIAEVAWVAVDARGAHGSQHQPLAAVAIRAERA